MRNKKDSVVNNLFLGLSFGIVIPFLTLIFVNADWQRNISFLNFLSKIYQQKALAGLLSLCVLPNLLIFYLFLRKDHYKTVKGIVMATALFAIAVFLLKFLI
jgi:hypothetical protein